MPKHILTVDDEKVILELLNEFLTALGYRVSQSQSVADALAVVAQDPPELLITDLQLVDSDGLDLIARVKESLPDLPVILLTGMLFDATTVESSLADKISAYVSKTAPLTQLHGEIKRLLG